MRRTASVGVPFLAALLTTAALAGAQPPGDAARGEELFATKQCARCHRPRQGKGMGPALEELRRPQGAYELAGRLWNHAPAMFTALTQEGFRWPEITATEMGDLMAYLGADASRDPAPNPVKGQLTLISKGCLKCHSFRREGARIAADLAGRDAEYGPPATWAAKMWRHTPRMAAKALEQGVLYPRFTGDEMINLLTFLRSNTRP